MERVKRLSLEKRSAFPSNLFSKTAGIFDNMMCCRSYAEQQLSVEAQEREREYREEISPGCGLDSVARSKRDVGKGRKVAPVPVPVQQRTNRPYDFNNVTRQYDFVDEKSPPQHSHSHSRKGKTASRATAPHSPIGSSYSTATTVTANTCNTADYTTEDSCSARSSSRSLRAETHEMFMRQSAEQHNSNSDRSLTDRTISVPSRSHRPIELDPEKRRWSEGCVEFEQQQQQHDADYYPFVPSEEVIRKVQSESLAELPYLSMTEGYRC